MITNSLSKFLAIRLARYKSVFITISNVQEECARRQQNYQFLGLRISLKGIRGIL